MKYEVIVVGAGPGGAFAARQLAKKGVKVLLIEKQTIPRKKPCAGWVTPEVFDLLGWDPKKLNILLEETRGGILWIKGEPLHTDYQRPIAYGILRNEFDTKIVEEARSAGADLIDGTKVTDIDIGSDRAMVITSGGKTFEGQIIIGAGGTYCPVAKGSGLRKSWARDELCVTFSSETRIGKEKAAQLTKHRGYPEFFFMPWEMGYGWYFLKQDYLSIGLGVRCNLLSRDKNLRFLLNNFLNQLRELGRLDDSVTLSPFRGYNYGTYFGPTGMTYGNRVLLVGDAGGFSLNSSGEGIRPALVTGGFAAEIVLDALHRGRFDEHTLSPYEEKWYPALRRYYRRGSFLIYQLRHTTITEVFHNFIMKEDDLRRLLFFDPFYNVVPPKKTYLGILSRIPKLTRYAFKTMAVESISLSDLWRPNYP
ncbi:MAG: NAD(P)/FAD-dependent oxidoreductase [Deltaproteobacteria bacterium]|nr:MAG: NAD(P)/FAD-dependent oxidoreductase [Deltaproteobacteria bacterium]